MWTVIYIAPNKASAERIQGLLSQEGILVKLRAAGVGIETTGPIEVMVPQGEAEEAHEILTENMGRVRF